MSKINIVLYEPEIHVNTGNIMRTCVATGAKLHLIEPLGFILDEKHLKRSGANNIEDLDYQTYINYEEFKRLNPGHYFFFTRYGHKPHSEGSFEGLDNIYLIFGKESTGIPKEILKDQLKNCYRIPMTSDVRSLNLSNSVAIVIYEVLRQKKYEGLLFDEPHKSITYLED